MRPLFALATSLTARASIAALAENLELAPEGRGLLSIPVEMPATTLGGTPPPHPFLPDPSGGFSRTIFETDENPDFKITIRDLSFPPDKQKHTVTLPSAAFLYLLSGDGEISIANQPLTLPPGQGGGTGRGASQVVNNGEHPLVPKATLGVHDFITRRKYCHAKLVPSRVTVDLEI
jgi:hypothetical protein